MPVYIITDKTTKAFVCRYEASAPTEWNGLPFSLFDHTESISDAVSDSPIKRITWSKLAYQRRFTQEERIAIRVAAANSPELADYLELLKDAEEVSNDDPDVIKALTTLEEAQLIKAGRKQEILYGN